MANIFQKDFRDFIKALNDCNVRYIMVGGMAVILHGHPRVTGDMDIWVERSEENYKKLAKAFYQFQMPLFDMSLQKFLNVNENDVFSFGRNPVGIDIMTEVKGLNFEDAYDLSVIVEDNGLPIRIINFTDLIKAKKASGRLKDLDDINQLKKKRKKMDLDKLNFLPDWNDDNFQEEEEGEAWKTNETRIAGKELYLKWREVFGLVFAFTENLSEETEENKPETHEQATQRFIYENAMMIAPKIRSASMIDMYILQMENAAIIRTNARQLMEQVGFAVLMGFADKNYKKVIEEAMNEFRMLFKEWVATFTKDEFEDEWGLFN